MSAAALGRGIRAGEIDPVELTEGFLEAIRIHPMRDRIYARLTEKRALAEAKAAAMRAKSDQRLSLLDGVPVSWKDLFDTAGTVTEAGSDLLKDRKPSQDARVVQFATATGLVCLGKTHMSELAFSGLGYNPIKQTPPCVNDHDAVSGGSSSGAAASVAFGLAPVAVGSDTGGSVRVPAAWNDLVGLKTSSGRLSLDGVVPLCARFDTVGPLSRSVEDAGFLLSAMQGMGRIDLRWTSLKGCRFALLQTVAMDDLDDGPRAGFNAAVACIESAGGVVEPINIPEVQDAMDLAGPLYTAEAYGTWRDVIEANPDLMFDQVRKRFQSGADVLAADYVAAWQKLDMLRTIFAEKTSGYDAVIVPTVPTLPPNLERLKADQDYFVTQNLMALRNTRIGNLFGLSALTLPTGVPSAGVTFMTPPMSEERLLRLGHAFEEALHEL